jgi:hypothetical protein
MYTAIIVEPRQHKALAFVLQNFLTNLSDEWNIIIIHGNLNAEYVQKIINENLATYKSRIKARNLGVDNLTTFEYSALFRIPQFYDIIPTETFLVFQTDTMIFEKYKHLINLFLKYDYVGAPWDLQHQKSEVKLLNGQVVGNGGLSLRKKSKMLEIIKKETRRYLPEDLFFSCTTEVELYKPSFEEAKFFSMEQVFSYASFGCHKPWRCGENRYNKELYLQYYPEMSILEELNR